MDATLTCPRCREEIAADSTACPACGHALEPAACARHSERTAAGQCVVCGRTLCEECDEGHAPVHLCDRHAGVSVIEGWAQVYSTGSDVQAQLIRENLEAEGIDSRVLSQKDHYSFNVELGDLSPVRVLVPAFAYGEAMDVLGGHLDGRGEVRFACPECGEAYEPGETACTACGTALD